MTFAGFIMLDTASPAPKSSPLAPAVNRRIMPRPPSHAA